MAEETHSKPTGKGYLQWLLAPTWATHILRASHLTDELIWAVKKGDDYYMSPEETRPLFMHPIGQHNGLLLGYRIYDERAPAIPSIKTSLFLISTPEHKPVFKPEPNGHWEHPSFRWSLIPPGAEYGTFFADIGYEITYCTRDIDDDPFEMECIGWEPEALGFGWFLVKITKDKNGQPLAIFAKQNTSTATLFSSNTSMR